MKWLFVTVDFPWPLVKGYCVRIYHLSRVLIARGDEVCLLCYPPTDEQRKAYEELGVEIIGGLRGRAVVKGKSRSFLGPFVYHEKIAEILSECGKQFDVIGLINSETLQYGEEAKRSGAFVWANVADDPVLEMYRRMRHLYDPIEFARYLKFIVGHLIYERSFVRYADLLTFVSATDAESFGRRHKGANVRFVPNGVDVDYYRRCDFERPECIKGIKGPIIVFPGNMSHPPNVDAAEFIVNEIAPSVWRKRGDVSFVLAGCNPEKRVCRLAGERVVVTGFVEDLRPVLWASSAVIIPMRIGTGIKNKLLEAWASESAVIATSHACQGIPAKSGENLLIGDSSAELAECILSLVRDEELRSRLAKKGRETVVNNMRWENTVERLYECMFGTKRNFRCDVSSNLSSCGERSGVCCSCVCTEESI